MITYFDEHPKPALDVAGIDSSVVIQWDEANQKNRYKVYHQEEITQAVIDTIPLENVRQDTIRLLSYQKRNDWATFTDEETESTSRISENNTERLLRCLADFEQFPLFTEFPLTMTEVVDSDQSVTLAQAKEYYARHTNYRLIIRRRCEAYEKRIADASTIEELSQIAIDIRAE